MTRLMVPGAGVAVPGWPVTQFSGEFWFLANPFPCRVVYEGMQYPSSEHAFQAAKTTNMRLRGQIAAMPEWRQAKAAGRSLALRPDWEGVKHAVMLQLSLTKYILHPDLRAALLGTGDRLLIEGNTWGDWEWGAVPFPGPDNAGPLPVWRIGESNHTWLAGNNWLGWTLMTVRDALTTTGVLPR
jgi:ribA/ribD-fused uncharacterized protein